MNKWILLLLPALLFSALSCRQAETKKTGKEDTGSPQKKMPFFKDITGIHYLEVRRMFDNGLIFNKHGFQQVPEWDMYFTSFDSVKIYSPSKKKYIHYPIYFDHDSVLNFAREWFRVKKVSRDTLILQLLQVQDRIISRERSNVYMVFYSEKHIKNTLRSDIENLRKPSRADTLFVRSQIAQAEKHPDSTIFAARNPVILESRSPLIEVEKIKVEPDSVNINNTYRSDEYLYPQYRISIHPAYKDFSYSFSVIVDKNGKMHFKRFLTAVMPEFQESQERVVKGIIDIYLQQLLKITPGNTMGFSQPSVINLYVKGQK